MKGETAMDNIDILNDTLTIMNQGYYIKDEKRIDLKLSFDEMKNVKVFLPDEVHALKDYKLSERVHVIGKCGYSCENADSFTVARSNYKNHSYLFSNKDKEILVLNFANPVNPGGGVRKGARAQEEDLCRTSSLLYSLESFEASEYYKYNRALNTYMGSDAVIITPKVEIIKDSDGNLLDESAVVAVMTCAAPMINYGLKGMSENQYQDLFYNRIVGMLCVAVYMGYKHLVLGAFGCGAFGNDAKIVSDLFYKALKEFKIDGMTESDLFRRIDFAVLSRSSEQYNYKEFYRNFGGNNFYREEIKKQYDAVVLRKKEKEKYLDKIRGSLIGGASGDALGYTVEFLQDYQIFRIYGKEGITEYGLRNGVAQISDDTQMTLFTANAILFGETRLAMRGIGGDPMMYAPISYVDWFITQSLPYEEGLKVKRYSGKWGISWLLDVPELYNRRAPGNTCMSAIDSILKGGSRSNYIKEPMNNSKGCGGVMRIAPLALHYQIQSGDLNELDLLGAKMSAITHGHPLGYMPSAVLTHILNRLVYPKDEKFSLRQIVIEARDVVRNIFGDNEYVRKLRELIDLAIELSENYGDDLENIRRLGEGWVAEETLAIAIYCSLKYQYDFSAGIIAAVNHGGDSDSTGAVTGNILGALLGYSRIEDKWKKNLELHDVICEMADDLCYGCHMDEYSDYYDEDWARKYMNIHWEKANAQEAESISDIINSDELYKINKALRNGGNL